MTDFFRKTEKIAEKFPEILDAINSDLDKAIRLSSRQHELEKADMDGELLISLKDCESNASVDAVTISVGRPRIQARLLLFFLTVRGYWGSVSDSRASEWLVDSISVRAVLNHFGVNCPGTNTVRENLNKIFQEMSPPS